MRPPVRPVDVQPRYHLFLVKTVLSIVVTASRPNGRHAVLAVMNSVAIAVVAMATIVVMVVAVAAVAAVIAAIIVILAGNQYFVITNKRKMSEHAVMQHARSSSFCTFLVCICYTW